MKTKLRVFIPLLILSLLLCGCAKGVDGSPCSLFEGRKLSGAAVLAPEESVLADLAGGVCFDGSRFDTANQLVLIEQFLGRVQLGAPCGAVPPKDTLYLRLFFEDGGEYQLGAFYAEGKPCYSVNGVSYAADSKQIPDIIIGYCAETLVTLAGEAPRTPSASFGEYDTYYPFRDRFAEAAYISLYFDYNGNEINLTNRCSDEWRELLDNVRVDMSPIAKPTRTVVRALDMHDTYSNVQYFSVLEAEGVYYYSFAVDSYGLQMVYPTNDQNLAKAICDKYDTELEEWKGEKIPTDYYSFSDMKPANIAEVQVDMRSGSGETFSATLTDEETAALCEGLNGFFTRAPTRISHIDCDRQMPRYLIKQTDGTTTEVGLLYGKRHASNSYGYIMEINGAFCEMGSNTGGTAALYSLVNVYEKVALRVGAENPEQGSSGVEVLDVKAAIRKSEDYAVDYIYLPINDEEKTRIMDYYVQLSKDENLGSAFSYTSVTLFEDDKNVIDFFISDGVSDYPINFALVRGEVQIPNEDYPGTFDTAQVVFLRGYDVPGLSLTGLRVAINDGLNEEFFAFCAELVEKYYN